MTNKINLSEFKQEKIHTSITFGENVVEIYNPTDKQKEEIIELVGKVNKDITDKDLILELIKMLTNITVGKNQEKILENPNETLIDVIDVLTEIMNNVCSRFFKNVNKLVKQNEIFDTLPKEIQEKISEIENKEINV